MTSKFLIKELYKRAKERATFKNIDGKTALALAAARAGALGAKYVLLIDEYIELYDVEKAEMYWWDSEEELEQNEWGERLRGSEVLYAVADKYGPIAFVLKL